MLCILYHIKSVNYFKRLFYFIVKRVIKHLSKISSSGPSTLFLLFLKQPNSQMQLFLLGNKRQTRLWLTLIRFWSSCNWYNLKLYHIKSVNYFKGLFCFFEKKSNKNCKKRIIRTPRWNFLFWFFNCLSPFPETIKFTNVVLFIKQMANYDWYWFALNHDLTIDKTLNNITSICKLFQRTV